MSAISVKLLRVGRRFATLAVAAALLLVPAADARAVPGGTPLSLNGFADLLVDEARQQVFVTGGTGSSSVVVMNYDGTLKKAIASMPGAAGMVLEGTTLYVARQGGNAIDLIDVTTLEKTGSLPLDTTTGGSMGMVDGRLWFLAGPCAQWSKLGVVDPATGLVNTYPTLTYYCPTFPDSPTDDSTLFLGEMGLSPTTVYKYDVSDYPSTPSLRRSKRDPAGGMSNLAEMALSTDQSSVYLAAGYPYLIPEIQSSDLEATGMTFATGPYPLAVDVADDAQLLAAGISGSYDPDIHVFRMGESTAIQEIDFAGSPTPYLVARGLEITSDGNRIFAVTSDVYGDAFAFRALHGPDSPTTTLDLTVSATSLDYGQAVTLQATLGTTDTSNDEVVFYAQPIGGSKTQIGSAALDPEGEASLVVDPEEHTTYTAEWAGDDVFQPASSSTVSVQVHAVVTGTLKDHYGLDGKYRLYHQGRDPKYRTKVVPNHAGHDVDVALQRRVNGVWKPVASQTFELNANSIVVVSVVDPAKGSKYRIRSSIDSHADHLGDTSPWSFFKVTA